MNKNILTLGLYLLTSAIALKAQIFSEDMSKLYEAYSNLIEFETEISVISFDDNDDLDFSMKLHLKKRDNQFIQSSGFYEYLINRRYSVMVLKDQKEITYRKLAPTEVTELSSTSEMNPKAIIDSLYRDYENVEFLGLLNNELSYKIALNNQLLKTATIYLDKTSYLLSKVEYLYNPNAGVDTKRVEINYSNNVTPNFSENEFSERNYFIKSGKDIMVHPNYTGYNLSDNTSENL